MDTHRRLFAGGGLENPRIKRVLARAQGDVVVVIVSGQKGHVVRGVLCHHMWRCRIHYTVRGGGLGVGGGGGAPGRAGRGTGAEGGARRLGRGVPLDYTSRLFLSSDWGAGRGRGSSVEGLWAEVGGGGRTHVACVLLAEYRWVAVLNQSKVDHTF